MDTVAYALLRSGLFGALPPAAFEALVRGLSLTTVATGEAVVREGDPADACYIIVSGLLEVSTRAPDGSAVVLTTLRGRDHFGEQALLRGDAARAASVVAIEPTELVRIGFDRLEEVFTHAPELRDHLVALGQRQLEERLSRRTDLVRRLLASVDTRPVELTLQNGHVLYRAGAPADAVYVVLSGIIELFEDRDGARVLTARVGPGLCIGERDAEKRNQTAVVDGPTRLLEVSREALSEITASSQEARDHLTTLEKVWELPQRGLVTQHLGTMDGQPCLSQLFHLADGSAFVSSHVLGSDAVRLQAARGRPTRTISTPDGAVQVGVQADGRIVAIEARTAGRAGDERSEPRRPVGRSAEVDAHPSAPVLAALFARAIEGKPLLGTEEAELARSGQIASEIEEFACACMRVSRPRIRAAMAAGCGTLEALKQRTGCAMACGSCVPGLLELLGETAFVPVRISRRQPLGLAGLRVFFESMDGASLPAALPGQHVVLRIRRDAQVFERPYTLSGAAGGPWEITVKREGRFTTWLFDEAVEGTVLEASRPRGTWIWDGGPAPVICLVSGIGLTPALCFARTLLREGWPHALVFDWSTRHEADAVLLGELPAARAPNFRLRTRFTERESRVTAADVLAYTKRYPTAMYFLCGSRGYMDTVSSWLRAGGVPEARISQERFDAGRAT